MGTETPTNATPKSIDFRLDRDLVPALRTNDWLGATVGPLVRELAHMMPDGILPAGYTLQLSLHDYRVRPLAVDPMHPDDVAALTEQQELQNRQEEEAMGPDLGGRAGKMDTLGRRRSTAEQLQDPEVRQFVNADHSRRGGTV